MDNGQSRSPSLPVDGQTKRLRESIWLFTRRILYGNLSANGTNIRNVREMFKLAHCKQSDQTGVGMPSCRRSWRWSCESLLQGSESQGVRESAVAVVVAVMQPNARSAAAAHSKSNLKSCTFRHKLKAKKKTRKNTVFLFEHSEVGTPFPV